ncbi:imidazole glycerol phosphate synthase subunit HisH [Alkalibaculum sp. M08DMB]|uniref:Imidazole glycerol phosphate synthase subunit HisH n=1 Tax=Alkalibaculum sporogenes TaxID=2655001 RepID=A0A6A7K7I4_9FIRM|nr:imidazole glycerol phosphate synthase subunit HisH [Alkalibaculum sporogenes]MPW25356.1 imidazole glycerol phosphate synthase subunit HisH [Alkalibaculum sporogenes]
MIAIVDYGVGNLKNVYTALKRLDLDVIITSNLNKINDAKAIVLPGVGAFKDAMENLESHNLISCLSANVKKGKPLLGICLGMQLLFDKSYEDGLCGGLEFIEGDIVRFSNELKVPHMGWNSLHRNKNHNLIKNVADGEYVYFVHSYYLKTKNYDDVLLYADYGVKVPAVIAKDNVFGMQFHPEKSSDTGIKLLQNFKELII